MSNTNNEELVSQAFESINAKDYSNAINSLKSVINNDEKNGNAWFGLFLALNSKQKLEDCCVSDYLTCEKYFSNALDYASGDLVNRLTNFKTKILSIEDFLDEKSKFLNAEMQINSFLKYADETIQTNVSSGYKILNDAKKIDKIDYTLLKNYETTTAKVKLLVEGIAESGILKKINKFSDEKEKMLPEIDKCQEKVAKAHSKLQEAMAKENAARNELNAINRDISNAENELRACQNKINSLERSITSVENKIRNAKEASDKNRFRNQKAQLEKDVNYYDREANKASNVISTLNKKVANMEQKLDNAIEATKEAQDKYDTEQNSLNKIYDELEDKKRIVFSGYNVCYDEFHDTVYAALNKMCDNCMKIESSADLFYSLNNHNVFDAEFKSYIYDEHVVKAINFKVRDNDAQKFVDYIDSLDFSLNEFINNMETYKNEDDYVKGNNLLFAEDNIPSIVIKKLEDAKSIFEGIASYKESNTLAKLATYQLGLCLVFTKPDVAINYLNSLGNYKESFNLIKKAETYIKQTEADKKDKLILKAIIAGCCIAIIAIIAIIYNAVK